MSIYIIEANLNQLARANTLVCVTEHLKLLKISLCMYYKINISSITSINSEANASEFIEIIEEMISCFSELVMNK